MIPVSCEDEVKLGSFLLRGISWKSQSGVFVAGITEMDATEIVPDGALLTLELGALRCTLCFMKTVHGTAVFVRFVEVVSNTGQ